jgi:hypothetical protein
MKHNKTRKRGGTRDVEVEYVNTVSPITAENGNHTTFSDNYITAQNVAAQNVNSVVTATPIEAEVLATTKKQKRGLFDRIYRKIGKTTGLIPNSRHMMNSNIDFDTDIFNGTCLENVILPIEDLAIIADYLENYADVQEYVNDPMYDIRISTFCELRNKMLSYDPEFSKKYPNLYKSRLDDVFYITGEDGTDDDGTHFLTEIDYLLELTPDEIREREHEHELRLERNYVRSGFMSTPGHRFMRNINRNLPMATPRYQHLPKRAGKRKSSKRTKKYKRKTRKYLK